MRSHLGDIEGAFTTRADALQRLGELNAVCFKRRERHGSLYLWGLVAERGLPTRRRHVSGGLIGGIGEMHFVAFHAARLVTPTAKEVKQYATKI